MTEQYIPSHFELAACAADALFGKVTANLRCVTCEWRGGLIQIQVVFEAAPNDEEVELISLFETYLLCGLMGDCNYNKETLIRPHGFDFQMFDVKIYRRFEGMEFA